MMGAGFLIAFWIFVLVDMSTLKNRYMNNFYSQLHPMVFTS